MVPGGYNKIIPGAFHLQITTKEENGEYVIDTYKIGTYAGTTFTETTINGVSVRRSGDTIIVTVENTPITGGFNLEIEKRAGIVTGSLITTSSATFTVNKTAPTTRE